MAKGRKPIVLNKVEFQEVVTKLENEQKFPNRSQLWEAVENTDWAKNQTPRPLTSQVAMLKAEDYSLIITTPKGIRGKQKGSGPVVTRQRKSRKIPPDSLQALICGIPVSMQETLQKTIDRAASGSMKAAVKLKCLDCCNWSKQEVSQCTINSCSLHNFRPYKKSSTELTVISNTPSLTST